VWSCGCPVSVFAMYVVGDAFVCVAFVIAGWLVLAAG